MAIIQSVNLPPPHFNFGMASFPVPPGWTLHLKEDEWAIASPPKGQYPFDFYAGHVDGKTAQKGHRGRCGEF